MAVGSDLVGVHVALPPDFQTQIESAMAAELSVASQKWGVSLSDEAREYVLEHSLRQLQAQVAELMKTSWQFDPVVSLKVRGLPKRGRADIHLPAHASKLQDVRLKESKVGWIVAEDGDVDSVAPEDMDTVIREQILAWARTAVFYGVGSYRR